MRRLLQKSELAIVASTRMGIIDATPPPLTAAPDTHQSTASPSSSSSIVDGQQESSAEQHGKLQPTRG
jgi:hypothetical protein